MADKSISELVAATAVGSTDLFVLEQTGTAKKLTGQILENWLVSFADGHGGIQTVAKTGTSGLVDTYTITYADTTTSTFTVTNGKAISSVTQYWAVSTSGSSVPSSWSTTRQTMTPTNKYLWSYMTITYNDGTTSDTTKSVVGVYGDTGQAWYVWIKYSAINPTSDADMGDVPDNWIGIYSGTSSTAPTHYTDYTWFQYKGEQGETGDASRITSQSVTYLEGTSGTVVPSGSWTTTIPSITPGNFLWTRTVLTFNDGSTVTAYSVSRYGIDGTGAVSTVNNVSPDPNGNVALTASNIPTSDNVSVEYRLQDAEAEIRKKETEISKRRFLFIGDSYNSVTGTAWSTLVATALGLQNSAVVAQGGYGFVTGQNKTWLSLLQNATIEDETTITDVLICGGANDAWAGDNTIPTAMATFDTYLNGRFSGLKNVWCGFAGNSYYNVSQSNLMRKAMREYIKGAKQLGWHYLNNIEATLLYPGYMQKIGTDDMIHPNADGVQEIANNIVQCLLTGSCENNHASEEITFTTSSSISSPSTFIVDESITNNMVSMRFNATSFKANGNLSGTITLGTCPELKNMLRTGIATQSFIVTSSSQLFVGTLMFTNFNTLSLVIPGGITISNGATFNIASTLEVFDAYF